MLVFFIVFVTSAVNQIFAQQVVNINTDVNHNICGNSNISQNEVSPASKSPVNNRVNSNGVVVFVNRMSDIFTDQGLVSAVKAVNLNSIGAISFFGAASYGESKYKTGSNVTLKGSLLLGGLVKGIDFNCGRLISGLFCDCGKSNYDTFNNFEAFASVKGHGHNKYTGGGFLGRFDFKNNLYGELSGRMGNVKTDFYSLYIAEGYDDTSAQHKYDSLCLGWHTGVGHLCKFSNSLGLDTYGKYFFMRQKGKDVVLPTDELIKFSDVDSRRFKLGTKLLYDVNSTFNFYGGGAYEYEFDGTVNATIANITIDAPCFKGGTGAYELGMTVNSGDFCIDLSLQKYIGLREGFTVRAKVSFAFLNYLDSFLGTSIEKFEKEKTGRFGKVFTMSQKDCFNKSLKIIKELRARVTRKSLKKGYIIAFDFSKSFLDYCLDSTEAGIFIADEGSNKVKVEVISNNSLLAKDFSVKFFEMLEQE
jgi:hypothetical protein